MGPGRSGRIGPPRPRQPLRLDPPGALPARCSLTARKPLKYPITSAIGAQPGAARPHADTLKHICRHQHPMHLAHPGAATQAPGMCVSGREGFLLTFLLSKGLDGARVVNHLGGHSLPAPAPGARRQLGGSGGRGGGNPAAQPGPPRPAAPGATVALATGGAARRGPPRSGDRGDGARSSRERWVPGGRGAGSEPACLPDPPGKGNSGSSAHPPCSHGERGPERSAPARIPAHLNIPIAESRNVRDWK